MKITIALVGVTLLYHLQASPLLYQNFQASSSGVDVMVGAGWYESFTKGNKTILVSAMDKPTLRRVFLRFGLDRLLVEAILRMVLDGNECTKPEWTSVIAVYGHLMKQFDISVGSGSASTLVLLNKTALHFVDLAPNAFPIAELFPLLDEYINHKTGFYHVTKFDTVLGLLLVGHQSCTISTDQEDFRYLVHKMLTIEGCVTAYNFLPVIVNLRVNEEHIRKVLRVTPFDLEAAGIFLIDCEERCGVEKKDEKLDLNELLELLHKDSKLKAKGHQIIQLFKEIANPGGFDTGSDLIEIDLYEAVMFMKYDEKRFTEFSDYLFKKEVKEKEQEGKEKQEETQQQTFRLNRFVTMLVN